MIIVNVQFCTLASPSRPLCNGQWYQEMPTIHVKFEIYSVCFDGTEWAYLLIPFSMVSSTNVDASCKNVRALALEKPEIAEDSESEDRRD